METTKASKVRSGRRQRHTIAIIQKLRETALMSIDMTAHPFSVHAIRLGTSITRSSRIVVASWSSLSFTKMKLTRFYWLSWSRWSSLVSSYHASWYTMMAMIISKLKTTCTLWMMIWSLGLSSLADTSANKWSTTRRKRSHSTAYSRMEISVRAAPMPSLSSIERAILTSACSRTLTIEWSASLGLAECLPRRASLRSCSGSATRKSSSTWASRRWWETTDHSTSAWLSAYLLFPSHVAAAAVSRLQCTFSRRSPR